LITHCNIPIANEAKPYHLALIRKYATYWGQHWFLNIVLIWRFEMVNFLICLYMVCVGMIVFVMASLDGNGLFVFGSLALIVGGIMLMIQEISEGNV
jgi:hypothetical protein